MLARLFMWRQSCGVLFMAELKVILFLTSNLFCIEFSFLFYYCSYLFIHFIFFSLVLLISMYYRLQFILFFHSLESYTNTIDIWSLGIVFLQMICLLNFGSLVSLLERMHIAEIDFNARMNAVTNLVGMVLILFSTFPSFKLFIYFYFVNFIFIFASDIGILLFTDW
jgi:hypothetical protein